MIALLSLLKNPHILGIGLVVLLCAGYVGKLHWDINNLEDDRATLEQKLLVTEALVQKQNAEVERLGRESLEKQQNSAKRAEGVLKAPLPSPTKPGAKHMNEWLKGV